MESFPNDFQRDNHKLKTDKNTKWGKRKRGRKKKYLSILCTCICISVVP